MARPTTLRARPRPVFTRRVLPALLLTLSIAAAGCSRAPAAAAPQAGVALTITPTDAAVGTPLDMTYTFTRLPGGPPLPDDAWVFVHFLDADGERLWSDDHQPPEPPARWQPGMPVRYRRTIFVPRYPYVGEARVEVGLYSRRTGDRVALDGADSGMRALRAATINVRLQTDDPVITYGEGWYEVEGSDDAATGQWRWSKKAGVLTFPNPRRDVVLFLSVDEPIPQPAPRRVEVRLGATPVDAFTLRTGQRDLRRIALTAAQLGDSPSAELTIEVDRAFVPEAMPELRSPDPRALGVRVFHAAARRQ